jgi:type IV fimbrial biogenesis protein FimT
MQRGVTLIELSIGLAIVAILLALGMPGFVDWIQNSQIRTAAESVQNGLQLARAEAVRRNTGVQFALTGADWTVGCDTAADDCPASIQTRSGTEGSANAVITPSEVQPSGAAAGTPVFIGTVVFNGLGRVNGGSIGAGNNASFLVTSNTGNCVACVADSTWGDCPATAGKRRCLRVVVSTGGQIRMCDPALASPTAATNPTPLGC